MNDRKRAIELLIEREIEENPPRTQQDCCAIAARVDLILNGIPENDRQLLISASGLAEGLFGPAFHAADEGQKWAWIDMCEEALREAMKR